MSEYQDWPQDALEAAKRVQLARYNLEPKTELLIDIGTIAVELCLRRQR